MDGSGGRSTWRIPGSLAILLLAAAAYRAVYFLLYARDQLLFSGLILDAKIYDAWARNIAAGNWLGSEAFYFAPLYPYLLAALYVVAGHSLALVYVGQSLLGLVILFLIYRLGASIFGARAGLYAACGAALYAPLLFFETKTLTTTLGLFLHLVALTLLLRAESAGGAPGWPGLRPWLLAGLMIGLTALALPSAILLALLYAGATVWRRPAAGGMILAGTLLCLTPILAHNLYVAGDPLPLSGQGGITFYQGNSPSAAGLYSPVPGFTGSPQLQAKEEKAIAERETGRTLSRSQVSGHFFRKGIAYILDQPGAWLRLEMRKLGFLLGSYEASSEYSLGVERGRIPWLWIPILPFAIIAGAGIGGLADRALVAGAGRGARALGLFTLYAAAGPLIFFVSSRYRLALVPALLIYGGGFLDRTVERARQFGALAVPDAWRVAVALLVALVSFFPLGRPNLVAEANVYYNLGNVLADLEQHKEAIAYYDRALADAPTHAEALINKGNSLDKLGRAEEALLCYHMSEEVRPSFWTAYKAQGIVLHRSQRFEEEIETYKRAIAYASSPGEAYFALGSLYKEMHQTDEAARALAESVRRDPRNVKALVRLGDTLRLNGNVEGARKMFQAALAIDPADIGALAGQEKVKPE